MLENSRTWQRISGAPERGLRINLGYVPDLEHDEEAERRTMRRAIVLAVALHVVFFLVRLPFEPSVPDYEAPERAVFAVQQLRFERPEPEPQQALPKPQRTAKRIPIPDPTPDDPEPILREEETIEIPLPELDALGIADFFIPDGPPAAGPSGPPAQRMTGDIVPPVKISGDIPLYTEEARQGRVQGVVILEAVIAVDGTVADVKVLKGLPLGLSDTAVAAAEDWRFRPALRNGEPVPVYYNLTVRFSLQ